MTGLRPLCACGKPATIVADVHQPSARVLACSRECREALGEGDIDVVVDAADFPKVMTAKPCWCSLRRWHKIPYCPKHGTYHYPKE